MLTNLTIAALSLLGGFHQTKKFTTLEEYLDKKPWDSSKGSLFVLEPNRVRAKEPNSLSDFKRMKVVIGDLTAYVPTMMTVIDSSLKEAPNMYDGLPMRSKIIYLLSTLSNDQWKKVSSKGIGFADLQGEQRAVFESLLPSPFRWSATRLSEQGDWTRDVKRGVLSDQQRNGVKLRVSREIEFNVYFTGKDNAFSFFETSRYRGKPGGWSYNRDQDEEFNQKRSFGLSIKQELPNQLKKAQLDFGFQSLSNRITVQNGTTVGALLSKIGQVSGLSLAADFRVSDRVIRFNGATSEARDLLKAMAYAVTGTYRKVGNTYILTSDLEGLGARKLKLAAWEEMLRQETRRRESAWKKSIGGVAGFQEIDFNSKDGFAPTKELRDKISDADSPWGKPSQPPFSTQLLTPELRSFLDGWDNEYRAQPIRKDVVSAHSTYQYGFVLPDGQALRSEGGIGDKWEFNAPENADQPRLLGAESYTLPVATNNDVKFGLAGAPKDESELQTLVAAVEFCGANKLWIQSENPSLIDAAVETGKSKGFSVGLILCPWKTNYAPFDCNIMGQSGRDLINAVQSAVASSSYREKALWVNPSVMSPTDLRWKSRRDLMKTLAHRPGLKGVVLDDTQPRGYEPTLELWEQRVTPLEWTVAALGYTVGNREEFIRVKSIDPIDIATDRCWTTPDLRQPFFLDDGLRGMPTTYDGRDVPNPKMGTIGAEWRKYVSKLNLDAVTGLASDLSDTELYVELRAANANSAKRLDYMPGLFAKYSATAGLPVIDNQKLGAMPRGETLVAIPLDVLKDPSHPGSSLIMLRSVFQPHEARMEDPSDNSALILDVSSIPISKLPDVLPRWLKPRAK